jgi:uncharacterized metal-binding protein
MYAVLMVIVRRLCKLNIKGHKRICLAIIAGHYIFTQDIAPLVYTGIVLGTILPDLDAEYSYVKKWFPWLGKLYDLLPKNSVFKHRGYLLHSIWTILACLILWYKLPLGLFWGSFLGILGHHVADWTTPHSLPNYFNPFDIWVSEVLKVIDKAIGK